MSATLSSYPQSRAGRNRWIVERRGARNVLDPWKPYGFFVEEERSKPGGIVPVATVLLSNRECPWRCLMCDLWKNTLTETVPAGAIPAQIDYALERVPRASQIKLYNSGSFFDPRAIPPGDYDAIGRRVDSFERVIVESHPALIGDRCFHFGDLLSGQLEVAMGLETVHPLALERLNKGMNVEEFAAAAQSLRQHGVDLRVFLLVKPPFMAEGEALEWCKLSIDFAFDCGATAVSLIPTRAGNGAMDELAATGDFAPPELSTVEAAIDYGISIDRGRVFADLWEASFANDCAGCRGARLARLQMMNLEQTMISRVGCELCEASV
jgi:radical SAM enzyme (TIGR01210 family)